MDLHYLFEDDQVDLPVLKKWAVGMRWAGVAEGVIPLTAADPDFRCDERIRKAMMEFIQDGYFPYAPREGIPGLPEAIVQYLERRKGVSTSTDLVLPIDSASAAMQAIACSILKPGDEAIIFDPVDLLFGISVRYAGATVVHFPSVYIDGKWQLDGLKALITPRTKMICLCNPHNPMGYLYTREELQTIAEIADRHNLWIMNDEIWSDIAYSEKPFISINALGPELNKRTISCYGFSKGYALPGLRAGFLYTLTPEAFAQVNTVANGSYGGVDYLTQIAMKTALNECDEWVDAFLVRLQDNRDYMFQRLNAMPGVKATLQEATFVTFPDIRETGMSSQEFADRMVQEAKVALVPGTESWFGPRASGHVRFCYSTSHAILEEAMDRVESLLKKVVK